MILAINTAQRTQELALIQGDKLLIERRWQEEKKAVDFLTPNLREMLSELGMDKSEIDEIIVVRGPGPFTAVRTGVAFANALAEGLGAELFELTTFELFQRKAALADSVLVILFAGGMEVAVQMGSETVRIGPIATLLKDYPHDGSVNVVSELPETLSDELHSICVEKEWHEILGHELQTLGESLISMPMDSLHQVEGVEPFYLRGAHITKSSDPWKK